jgi:hypothetical protein
MDTLIQDIRYGLRLLGKNPRFAAVVIMDCWCPKLIASRSTYFP